MTLLRFAALCLLVGMIIALGAWLSLLLPLAYRTGAP